MTKTYYKANIANDYYDYMVDYDKDMLLYVAELNNWEIDEPVEVVIDDNNKVVLYCHYNDDTDDVPSPYEWATVEDANVWYEYNNSDGHWAVAKAIKVVDGVEYDITDDYN